MHDLKGTIHPINENCQRFCFVVCGVCWLGFSRPVCPVCEKDLHFKILLKSSLKSINITAIVYFKRIHLRAKIMFLDTLHVNYYEKENVL